MALLKDKLKYLMRGFETTKSSTLEHKDPYLTFNKFDKLVLVLLLTLVLGLFVGVEFLN